MTLDLVTIAARRRLLAFTIMSRAGDWKVCKCCDAVAKADQGVCPVCNVASPRTCCACLKPRPDLASDR